MSTPSTASSPSRFAVVVQRFMRAKQLHRTSRAYSKRCRLRDFPVARAQEAESLSLSFLADHLVSAVEKLFGPHFRLSQLCDNWDVVQYRADEFEAHLRLYAFVTLNCEYLRSFVDDLRFNCGDYRTFDRIVYDEQAIGLLIESAKDGWNRTGAGSLLRQAHERLRTHAAGMRTEMVLRDLISEDDALDQMLGILEAYAKRYEELMSQATELKQQAAAATNA